MTSLAPTKTQEKPESWLDLIKTVLLALLIAGVIRTAAVQPFRIPSGSMQPTLLVGDYIIVSKWSYGYSKYSPPFFSFGPSGRLALPLLSSKPKRGDVIVFRPPGQTDTDFVKRLVGLPGDRIQMRRGILYVNGEAVKRELVGKQDFQDWKDEYGKMTRYVVPVEVYRETLPNGVTYTTFNRYDNAPLDDTRVFEVPEGHYFMMGDDRDNSDDSRQDVGFVPFENLVGRAEFTFVSFSPKTSFVLPWTWFTGLRGGRLFKPI